MNTLLRRLDYLLHRRRFDQELADDLEFHRDMAARHGNPPPGNALLLREEARDAWGWTWIDRLGQDLRYALRTLRRSPVFALTTIMMLAVGIGANVAVFGFFNLLVLRPLAIKDPDSLVRLHRRGLNQYSFTVPYPEAAFLREHSRTLSAVIAVNRSTVSIEGQGKPVEACFVTANYFRELGGSPSLGRGLDPVRDEPPGAEPVVVLAHGFWRSQLGADPSLVGRTIRINGKAATIAGVAASDFVGVASGLREPAFWAPITQQPYFASGSRLLTDVSSEGPGVALWGRLAPGQNTKAAEEELASLAAELRHQYPEAIWEHERLLSEPGGYATGMMNNRRGTGAEDRDPIYPIFALAATLTLLILAVACGNLGSVLLARGVARQREISIRVAIGAGRGRLIRQLFTESLLLASLGAGAGLALGGMVLRVLLAATGAPPWMDAAPDWRMAAFALAAGFVSAILFGLAPALQVGRQPHSAGRVRQILIGGQVAASCVLLIVAGLLVRALQSAATNSPGYDYEQVLLISPGLNANGYPSSRAQEYLGGLRQRLQSTAGVRSVALAISPPLGHITITAGTDIDDRHIDFQVNHVSPEYFETMSIPVLRGRAMRPGERHVVVVSEAFARQAWPGEDPLGKSLALGDRFTVVGISRKVHASKFGDTDSVQAYFPIEEGNWTSLSLLVSTDGSPNDFAASALAAARAQDPNLFPEVELMSRAVHEDLQGAAYSALAVSTLGLIAQLLACFGIVGVVSYTVSQRTKQIGIRLALGARPAHVLAVVLSQLAIPVCSGLFAGTMAAAGLSQVLRGRLYGLSNLDPGTYVSAIAVFVVTAALAAALPAQRALRIDPVHALHHE
jgi:predicted permease